MSNHFGSPVIVAELDRLGNSKNNQKFFIITLLISLCLLYYTLRDWKLTGAILGITCWSINLTLTIVKLTGGEMNFILGALSVMVMVFTLAICVHILHYYQAAADEPKPITGALRRAWKPCCLATLTTTVRYCFVIDAVDEALDKTGAANGNVAQLVTEVLVTWNANP